METTEPLLEQVRQAALRLAGVTGEVTLLGGEYDLNARVGEHHLVKLPQPGVDPGGLALQDAVLRHLADSPVASYVPRLVASSLDDPDPTQPPARVLSWMPGRLWRDLPRPTPEQLRQLGRIVAAVDAQLAGFTHPGAERDLDWNLLTAPDLLDRLPTLTDPERRETVEAVLRRHAGQLAPRLARLPRQVIHNDANDYNVIVAADGAVRGLVDFGDVASAPRICGLAIACAYATFSQRHPVRDVAPLVGGYHEVSPLAPEELELLLDLMRSRLATSVLMAAWGVREQPDNAHLLTSHDDAWRVLPRLVAEDDVLALCRFRAACGYEPHPSARDVRRWLETAPVAPVLSAPLAELPRVVLDWSAGNPDAPAGADDVRAAMAQAGAAVAIGRYGEDRAIYRGAAFTDPDGGPPRTVHLGVDLFAPAGTPVRAPLDGVIHAFHDNAAPFDYGPVIVLAHRTPDGTPYYTLYGHLSRESLQGKRIGDRVRAGEQLGAMGEQHENGGWAPHLHFQILLDLVGRGTDVPGVAGVDELAVWRSLSPDPNLVLRAPERLDAEPAG